MPRNGGGKSTEAWGCLQNTYVGVSGCMGFRGEGGGLDRELKRRILAIVYKIHARHVQVIDYLPPQATIVKTAPHYLENLGH